MNIAMWSGPRNLSTAMMYAFGARGDFEVVDEPFYGAYLAATGLDHPLREEIIASMETDPGRVAERLAGAKNLYSKQMTQHMIEGFPRNWFSACRHAFLIRHPARVVASYAAKRERPVLDDIGFRQQAEIFEEVRAQGQSPVVVDSFDIRADPERILRKLCDALELRWEPAMLSWPPGGHPSDGVWAVHWYGAVHASTGFDAPEGPVPAVDAELRPLVDAAMTYYDVLSAHRL